MCRCAGCCLLAESLVDRAVELGRDSLEGEGDVGMLFAAGVEGGDGGCFVGGAPPVNAQICRASGDRKALQLLGGTGEQVFAQRGGQVLGGDLGADRAKLRDVSDYRPTGAAERGQRHHLGMALLGLPDQQVLRGLVGGFVERAGQRPARQIGGAGGAGSGEPSSMHVAGRGPPGSPVTALGSGAVPRERVDDERRQMGALVELVAGDGEQRVVRAGHAVCPLACWVMATGGCGSACRVPAELIGALRVVTWATRRPRLNPAPVSALAVVSVVDSAGWG